jgi:deoxycytidylate deaminase
MTSREEQRKEEASQAELFFGLVGATGTDLGMVELGLSDALRELNYIPIPIRLSDLIEEHFNVTSENRPKREYNRISNAMKLGNKLRALCNDAVALLGVAEIKRLREQEWLQAAKVPNEAKPEDYDRIPLPRRAYILRSLKHKEEVDILRQIYGESFFVISAYSSRANRKARSEKRIAESEIGCKIDRRVKKADLLMHRDFTEAETLKNGQNVRDTFPLADLFVNADNQDDCEKALIRFTRLVFGDPQQTPTIDEYCMFHAKGAALRSGDLGRQVGAIIASTEGDVICHGTNEAPKAFGGQAWSDNDTLGLRGIAQLINVSDQRKKSLLSNILHLLLKNERIGGIDSDGIDKLAEEVFSDNRPKWIKGAELLELIGFYISVHAETAAIINAARLGISVRHHSLYVTAFPCHECARHILAAGIERVLYIEPYPKSLAGEHYPKSIAIDELGPNEKIPFLQFVGIAPRAYMRFFEALERKNKDGTPIKLITESCSVRYYQHWLAYTEKEKRFCFDLEDKLRKRQTIAGGSANDESAQKEIASGGTQQKL